MQITIWILNNSWTSDNSPLWIATILQISKRKTLNQYIVSSGIFHIFHTMYGVSTTVMVSSSIKYMNLIFRIKSYCFEFGSNTFWRKKPSKVKMILSFCTKAGLNAAIGFDFTRPYIHVQSYLIDILHLKPKRHETNL